MVADSSSGNDEAFFYDSDGVDQHPGLSVAGRHIAGSAAELQLCGDRLDRVGLYSSNDDDVKDDARAASGLQASRKQLSLQQAGEAIERP